MTEENTMRRQPKQVRSQQRVNHLLDTAAQLFAEVGYETATTNMIAARADLPIGSLYQFFPNKEAIFDALVERYLEYMRQLLSFGSADDVPISVVVGQMVDGIMAFDAEHTGFKAIFITSNVDTQIHSEIVGQVNGLLTQHFPLLNEKVRTQAAMAGVGIFKGLMQLVLPPSNLSPDEVAPLIKRALLSFMGDTLKAENHPLPPDLE